jgi:hypothetical protein
VSAPPRARRAIALALVVLFGHRLLGAWLIALPFSATISGAGVLRFPDGEALLFEPGAYYLVETVLREQGELTSLALAAGWPLLVWALLSLVPLWFLLDAVRHTPRSEALPERARRELPSLLLLAGVSTLSRLLTVSVSLGFVLNLRSALAPVLDERAADLTSLLPGVLGLVLLCAVSLVHDLARTAVVEHGSHAAAACVTALTALRARAAPLVVRYTSMKVLEGLCLGLGLALMVWLNPAEAPHALAVVSFGVHQLLVLLALVARAAWLWAASRACAAEPQPR